MEEELPISEKIKPIESVTLYKTGKWWAAIVLLESFGRKQIAFYLWLKSNDKWKRKQKFVIRTKEEWEKIKEIVDNLISKLST